MSHASDAGPSAGKERFEILDALRGFALFGIFLANIRVFSGWEFIGDEERSALAPGGYQWIEFLNLALVDGKFYTLFALLFGIGFALQLQRLEARGARATRIYMRRTTILLFIGLIHMFLVWLGDILTPYALLGFVLLAVRRWSDRGLLIAAGIALMLPIVGYAVFWLLNLDKSLGLYGVSFSLMPPGAANPIVDLRLTDWGDRLQAAIGGGVLRLGYLFDTWRWPKLFAIMLLGLWAGRRLMNGELFENTRLLVSVLVIGGICGGIAGPILAALGGLGFNRPYSLQGFYAVVAYTFAVIPLGLAYAAAFALAWRFASGVLRILAAPGRMALTNYLSQTLISVAVFYGIGLGQAGLWSVQKLLGFVCLVFLAQVIFSHLWLRAFRYGPAEWLWRGLTYGKLPALRRAA